MAKRSVIVVGAGAAGLMAASQAALGGAEVLLLEKMHRPACKLAITGKGRCNLTNTAPMDEFMAHFGKGGRFLRPAFYRFFSGELIEYFEQMGVGTVAERGGRVFTESGNARELSEKMAQWTVKSGVDMRLRSSVKNLIIENERVCGVVAEQSQEKNSQSGPRGHKTQEYRADTVIIATGGMSYPGTGSTGDGYRLAESAGHTIIPARPALVPLETADKTPPTLVELNLKNVGVSIWSDGKKQADDFGELLFTGFGVSGPTVLSLSRGVVDMLSDGKSVSISIDLKPAMNVQKLDARLLRDLKTFANTDFLTLLAGLLPSKMIPVCIDKTGIPGNNIGHQITAADRKRLLGWLKDFRLEITGHRPFKEAIVTAGGIERREINPQTMESRIVSGLYFAGEVIDIDADTGGYNLQAAFSTGWLAAQA